MPNAEVIIFLNFIFRYFRFVPIYAWYLPERLRLKESER
jgi:hypothetical protein